MTWKTSSHKENVRVWRLAWRLGRVLCFLPLIMKVLECLILCFPLQYFMPRYILGITNWVTAFYYLLVQHGTLGTGGQRLEFAQKLEFSCEDSRRLLCLDYVPLYQHREVFEKPKNWMRGFAFRGRKKYLLEWVFLCGSWILSIDLALLSLQKKDKG